MATPPTLTHYQRLQGYARVVHNLVWNPETGDFEVEAQSSSSVPTPSLDASYVPGFTGRYMTTVDKTIGGTTWRKTITWTGDHVTAVSGWVEL
jgi:hypothetical protein